MHSIGIIGGTGPEGRGLATRFAIAGHKIIIGSRNEKRGLDVATELSETLNKSFPDKLNISGTNNLDTARESDIAIITVPYDAHLETLSELSPYLSDKIVIDAVVPVKFERGPRPIPVEAGSATEEAAKLLNDSSVIGAFHNLSAEKLLQPDLSLDSDVLITGNNSDAKNIVIDLANEIKGVRAIDAGPLRYSQFIENLTVLLIGINGRYKIESGLKISGID